jgi:hypothetical protein
MKINGACQCGYITIGGEANAKEVRVCHCTDCQTNSGSAFRFNVPVAGDTFKMTGEPTIYIKTTAESGRPRAQAFCPKCGSPIYTSNPGPGPHPSYMVRAGILAQRDQLMPKKQIWFRSALSWITGLDALSKVEKQA